jgi:hypothetical protein
LYYPLQMTTLEYLDKWKQTGAISGDQYSAIATLVRKERFSVFVELNVLLYLGVLSFVAGVAWVIQVYAASFGDLAILSALTLLLVASYYYCFSRRIPYSSGQVESPTLAFDYVLYLACLIFAIELGYVENRFHLLQNDWDLYLLLATGLYFALAYRFDNRFVLSFALSTLGGWFGIKVSRWGLLTDSSLRGYAMAYSVFVAAIGTGFYRLQIKKHFTETYYHVAAIVMLSALLSGVFRARGSWLYVLALCGVAAFAIRTGLRYRRLSFVVYATIYGYIGISAQLIQAFHLPDTVGLAYLVVSASLVVIAMVRLASRFNEERNE